jgi:hypothetical protein
MAPTPWVMLSHWLFLTAFSLRSGEALGARRGVEVEGSTQARQCGRWCGGGGWGWESK